MQAETWTLTMREHFVLNVQKAQGQSLCFVCVSTGSSARPPLAQCHQRQYGAARDLAAGQVSLLLPNTKRFLAECLTQRWINGKILGKTFILKKTIFKTFTSWLHRFSDISKFRGSIKIRI